MDAIKFEPHDSSVLSMKVHKSLGRPVDVGMCSVVTVEHHLLSPCNTSVAQSQCLTDGFTVTGSIWICSRRLCSGTVVYTVSMAVTTPDTYELCLE